MWLMICSENDSSALWAFQGLQARGLRPFHLVTSEMLTQNAKWEHTVGVGGAQINITLADGRVINNRQLRGVVNRMTHVPLEHLAGASDYDYAVQEYTALFMSWLNALPDPIFNRVDTQGLSGAWRHASEWVWLATQAGLPTPEYQQTSHDQIDEGVELRRLVPETAKTMMAIAVRDRVFGPTLPTTFRKGCAELARISKTPLLGIEFAVKPGTNSLVFAGATPMPDLRLGGEPLLDALAVNLFRRERSDRS
jgi:hypothetical protein